MSISLVDMEYFNHYIKHTYYVTIAWKAIREELWNHELLTADEFKKINNLIIWHDQSKMSQDEWKFYAERFYGENQNDDSVKNEFKTAVKKHKQKNLHHYESLKDYLGDDWKCYIVELVCDYIAMGWEFNNFILEYYDSVREKINLPNEYKEYLEDILKILKEVPKLHIVEEPLSFDKASRLVFEETILMLHQKSMK